MREFFYEESATSNNKFAEKTRYKLLNFIQIALYFAVAVWSLVVYLTFDFNSQFIILAIIILVPDVVFVLSAIFVGKIKSKFCIDYDYTIASSSIRLSKVINDNKRYSIYVFESSKISLIGNYGSSGYKRLNKAPDVKTEVLSTNPVPKEGKRFYYIFVPDLNGEKKLLLLECTATFIKNLCTMVNKTVIEDGFKIL